MQGKVWGNRLILTCQPPDKIAFMKKLIYLLCLLLASNTMAQELSVSKLYEQVNKAVVSIYTQEKVPVQGMKQQMATSDGIGSGVLLSEKGDILTASHVVHNAEHILVSFADGEKVTARVIGSVVAADLAHIRLDWMPENRTIVKLGDSDEARIGDEVVVIGSPYGIDRSLSTGHISGRHIKQSISDGFENMELFQTDAAINKGNSGGPMFNMQGEVIGIVSHILTETGGFQGIGFVVSSNLAKQLLIEQKAFWSGFESFYLVDEMADLFNLPQNGGLLVQRVVINSPAFDMGLKGGHLQSVIEEEELLLGGDIILSVNDISAADPEFALRVRQNLIELKKGDLVSFRILRGGKILNLKSTSFIKE